LHGSRQEPGAHEPEQYAGDHSARSVLCHETNDLRASRAQCHADADLPLASRDRVREHAVDAERREGGRRQATAGDGRRGTGDGS